MSGRAWAWARVVAAAAGVVLAAACGAGTTGDDAGSATATSPETYVLAFQVTDDRSAFVERTEPLADWLSEHTGVPTRVLTVQDDRAQITALATGQAHAAYMSGGAAWIGWQQFDLDAIVAEVREADGRTAYVAGLWVLADSGLETIEDLRGTRSCHTGELTGTGMFVPMGHLIANGYVDTDGVDLDDVSSLPRLRRQFFSASQIGGGYQGAFQCLSTGRGDVATGRDTAWEDFCGGAEPAAWCRPRDDYRFLPGPDEAPAGLDRGLARVPSHPVMVAPHLPEADRAALRDAFLALGESNAGRRVLTEILGVAGLVPVDADEHLGPYGEVIRHVPGITAHFVGEAGGR